MRLLLSARSPGPTAVASPTRAPRQTGARRRFPELPRHPARPRRLGGVGRRWAGRSERPGMRGGRVMRGRHLHESFTGPGLDPRLRWHCEPARWSVDMPRHCLRIEPDGGTDFWQRTHYGFEADNGHLLFAEVPGDFVLATRVRFHPVH